RRCSLNPDAWCEAVAHARCGQFLGSPRTHCQSLAGSAYCKARGLYALVERPGMGWRGRPLGDRHDHHGRERGSVAEPLHYQEMLRTIGTLLDMCRCERGILVVSPHGAEVSAPGWEYSRDWTMAGLGGVSALQKTWRGHPSAYRLPSVGHRWRLRVVGAEL